MAGVVSVGSVNVDRVRYCDRAWLDEQTATHEWFPGPGETVAIDSVPAGFRDAFDRTFLGGKGANQAVAAAGAGAESAFLGAVGRDGDVAVRDTLADRGVDVAAVAAVEGPTGTAFVAVDEAGENYIAIHAGANDAVDADYVAANAEGVRTAAVVLCQNEIPPSGTRAVFDAVAGLPRGDRPVVVFDPAPADEDAADLLAHEAVDVATPNATEAAQLGSALDAARTVLVRTDGADGVSVDGPTDHRLFDGPFSVTPPSVDPVDTTGAGDVFAGFLAAALADGATLRSAVGTATAAAALSTTEEGVQTAVPEPAAVAAARERATGADR